MSREVKLLLPDDNEGIPQWGRPVTPEGMAWIRRHLTRPRMLCIEVTERTWKAVKARPDELRLIAKDEHSVEVIERPHRPRDDGNAERQDYNTLTVLRKD